MGGTCRPNIHGNDKQMYTLVEEREVNRPLGNTAAARILTK